MEAKKRFKNPLALSVIGFPSFIHTACKQKPNFSSKTRSFEKDRPFYQRTEFSLKFRVFSKLPCF